MKPIHILFVILVVLVALSRTLPHPPNFTPLMALALFSGAVFKSRWVAYLLPLGAMILSDAIIGFHSLSGVVYLSMAPLIWMGQYLESARGENQSRFRFLGGWLAFGLTGDLIFFALSNLGVWWFSGYYERTFVGFTQCFVLALPFLKNQMAGTTTFLGLLLLSWYGLMYLARMRAPNYNPIKVRRM